MHIASLTPELLAAALAYLRRSPYRNALLLSNVSQLREHCDVVLALQDNTIVGIASTYRDLPVANFTFAAERDATVTALLHALVKRNPPLRGAPAMALLPTDRFRQASRVAAVTGYEIEYQLGVEPETLRVPAGPPARRLTRADLPAVTALAAAAGLTVWHEGALDLGPAFGCFAGDQLVAMAATHFATPDVIEIGHVATHPDFRGRGYAKAATTALTQSAFGLAPRVFLMVLEHNLPARAVYRALGFYPIETFYAAHFRLGLRDED